MESLQMRCSRGMPVCAATLTVQHPTPHILSRRKTLRCATQLGQGALKQRYWYSAPRPSHSAVRRLRGSMRRTVSRHSSKSLQSLSRRKINAPALPFFTGSFREDRAVQRQNRTGAPSGPANPVMQWVHLQECLALRLSARWSSRRRDDRCGAGDRLHDGAHVLAR